MSKVVYDVIAITGKYMKDGVEKNRYMKCGVVLQGDKGLSLKLEAVPIGSNGWFQLYEPKEKQDAKPKAGFEPGAEEDFHSDPIPF